MLTSIFAFLPLLGRLFAVSLVCKRWRSAAVRSVTALQFRGGHLQEQLNLFPSLTSLSLEAYANYPALPTTLRSLSLTLSPPSGAPDSLSLVDSMLGRLPRLSSLSLIAVGNDTTALMSFLAQHASQLTSLSVISLFALPVISLKYPLVETLVLDVLQNPANEVDVAANFPCLANLGIRGMLSRVARLPWIGLTSIT